ncbi:hypothetical protein [Actinomyces gerencseriae]|uniref:hypothetical protein n=1 Tax=Actinomyces gerencseriae TaxID=52769 RepID=UPI0023F00C80|nr:hypothetical protein [Actinomyces gerencseriae]
MAPRALSALLRRGAALAVFALVVVSALAPDAACPPASGAETGESTTGTASTVSPSTVAVGGTLTYTLSGFPPGAAIRISVDDGVFGNQARGQDVVGVATVNENGATSGAVELPGHVAKGVHWLRFEVSAGRDVPTNEVSTLDYTNKSPYFTVGDVTIIGGSGAATATAPAPAPTSSPMIGTPEPAEPAGSEASGTAVPDVPDAPDGSRTTQVDITTGEEDAQASAVEVGARTFPTVGASALLLVSLLVLLAVIGLMNSRRFAADKATSSRAAG